MKLAISYALAQSTKLSVVRASRLLRVHARTHACMPRMHTCTHSIVCVHSQPRPAWCVPGCAQLPCPVCLHSAHQLCSPVMGACAAITFVTADCDCSASPPLRCAVQAAGGEQRAWSRHPLHIATYTPPSLDRSLTHPCPRSLTHSPTRSLTHPCPRSLHSPTHSIRSMSSGWWTLCLRPRTCPRAWQRRDPWTSGVCTSARGV